MYFGILTSTIFSIYRYSKFTKDMRAEDSIIYGRQVLFFNVVIAMCTTLWTVIFYLLEIPMIAIIFLTIALFVSMMNVVRGIRQKYVAFILITLFGIILNLVLNVISIISRSDPSEQKDYGNNEIQLD